MTSSAPLSWLEQVELFITLLYLFTLGLFSGRRDRAAAPDRPEGQGQGRISDQKGQLEDHLVSDRL